MILEAKIRAILEQCRRERLGEDALVAHLVEALRPAISTVLAGELVAARAQAKAGRADETLVLRLLAEIERAHAEVEACSIASMENFITYKQRRNEQFAAYEKLLASTNEEIKELTEMLSKVIACESCRMARDARKETEA